MPILDMPPTCTLSSHSWPGALLSGRADKVPDHNCRGEMSQSHKGICDILCEATLAEVDHFPSSSSIRWAMR